MKQNRIYAASIAGEILEWYDFSLYSFLVPVFAVIFFPAANPYANLLSSLAILAAGFLSRPIGGLVFGRLGDLYGRKYSFLISLIAMAIPTGLIGLLPTYSQVGILAPLLLLTCRLMQGFACGGEFSTSMIFLSEHAKQRSYYFAGSLAWLGAMVGVLCCSVTITLLSYHQTFLFNFGWRIPYLIGALIALAGIIIRYFTDETPVFLRLQETRTTIAPLMDVIKKNKQAIVLIILLNTQLAVMSYVGMAFLPTYLAKFIHMPLHDAMLLNTLLIASLICLIPLFGLLADKIGGTRLLFLSYALALVLSLPIFYLFASGQWHFGLLAALLLALPMAMSMAVTAGISAESIEPAVRVTIVGFAYNVTYCFLGGTSPLIAAAMIQKTGYLLFPGAYIVAATLITAILYVCLSPSKKRR